MLSVPSGPGAVADSPGPGRRPGSGRARCEHQQTPQLGPAKTARPTNPDRYKLNAPAKRRRTPRPTGRSQIMPSRRLATGQRAALPPARCTGVGGSSGGRPPIVGVRGARPPGGIAGNGEVGRRPNEQRYPPRGPKSLLVNPSPARDAPHPRWRRCRRSTHKNQCDSLLRLAIGARSAAR
jgi:hypothetical protein